MKQIYLENDELYIEVNDSDEIVCAETWSAALCDWIDVTKRIQASDFWIERVNKAIVDYDYELKISVEQNRIDRMNGK